jgi:hypothetical protein
LAAFLIWKGGAKNDQELFGYAVLTDWERQGSAIKIAEAAAAAAPPKAVPIIRSLG